MLKKLTPTAGELLLVWRKREELNQGSMAARFNVNRTRWGRWERGEDTSTVEAPLGVEQLLDHEKCMLLRRRSGITQGELAKTIGVSRWWLNQMESGKADPARLVTFWENRDEV